MPDLLAAIGRELDDLAANLAELRRHVGADTDTYQGAALLTWLAALNEDMGEAIDRLAAADVGGTGGDAPGTPDFATATPSNDLGATESPSAPPAWRRRCL